MCSIVTMERYCVLHLDFLYYNQIRSDVLFKFPVDSKLRRAWRLQVQRTRDKCKGPSEHSYVVSTLPLQKKIFQQSTIRLKLN